MTEDHYYPFGLKHHGYANLSTDVRVPPGLATLMVVDVNDLAYKYRYNSQEYQDELGLNVTAMDFRQYDSAIGRFYGMDRLSELGYSITPYRFAYNNPVYWSDPTGLLEKGNALTDYYDKDGVVYFDPKVGPDNLPAGATYIGPTYFNEETGTFWDENGTPHLMETRLEEVTVTATRSMSNRTSWFYNHDGFVLWGQNRHGDLGGHKNGTRKHSIETSQIPTGFGRARDSRGKKGVWEWLFSWWKNKADGISRVETIEAIIEDGNTSTMEVQNIESVAQPDIITVQLDTTYYHHINPDKITIRRTGKMPFTGTNEQIQKFQDSINNKNKLHENWWNYE